MARRTRHLSGYSSTAPAAYVPSATFTGSGAGSDSTVNGGPAYAGSTFSFATGQPSDIFNDGNPFNTSSAVLPADAATTGGATGQSTTLANTNAYTGPTSHGKPCGATCLRRQAATASNTTIEYAVIGLVALIIGVIVWKKYGREIKAVV